MSSEFECVLRDQVIIDLAKGLAFKTAFANAAHRHRVFHSNPAQTATYNYLYRAVEKHIKRSLGTDQTAWSAKAKEKTRSVSPPKPAPAPSAEHPTHRRAFTGQMAAAGERPEDYD